MQMEIKNLTPHSITLRDAAGDDHVIPASGDVARVATTPGKEVARLGVPVFVVTSPVMGEVENLPPACAGVVLIVSTMVAAALAGKGRSDVFSPGTGPQDGAIREDGKIIAVTRLIQAPQ